MSEATITPEFDASHAPVISLRELTPYAFFVFLMATMLLYFVGAEAGATSVFPGMTLHEFVHDGRHLLGFPCH